MEVGALKYTWKIKNFSNPQTRILHSDVFSQGPNKWNILALPKAYNGDGDCLTVLLGVPDSESLPSGWSRKAKFSLTVVNQIKYKPSYKLELDREFKETNIYSGFYISHEKLYDSENGFLVDDTCIIEADVTIMEDAYVESHSTSKEIDEEEFMNKCSSEDMDKFFVDLQSVISASKVVSSEEEVKQALAIIEEALNMVPTDANNHGRMFQLTNAFDVLCSLDDCSILALEQKAKLLSVKNNFLDLPERAAKAVKDIKLFTEKELVKKTLDQKLGKCLIEFEKAKAEIMQNKQTIASLQERVDSLLAQIGETKKKEANSLLKQKETFKVSKKLRADLDALVRNWPEYEAKKKAAEQEEKIVNTEWSEMKELISSLKKLVYPSVNSYFMKMPWC